MADVTALANERQQVIKDLYFGNVPARVPVSNPLALDAMCEYAGASVAEVYWDITKAEHVFDKTNQDFPADSGPGGTRRYPSFYQLLGSKPFMMSSSGTMQHPNVEGMEVEDYDALISSPYDCIIERILPRLYTELNKDTFSNSLALAKGYSAWQSEMADVGAMAGKIRAKYGFAAVPGGATTAPFDFLADFFRGFTGSTKDIRRMPEKVVQACEALTPLLVKKGALLGPPAEFGMTIIPLHMAPYLRTSDFEKFYFPSLKAQVEQLTEMGINVQLFVEHDFMRYLDHLSELPAQTILRFEYGDPKLVKEKLGKKFIISGFYPITLLHTGTKQECVDKAKELLDILAPGGNYMFDFDKGVLDMSGNMEENLKAVLEYVNSRAAYSPSERANNKPWAPKPNNSVKIVSEIEKKLSANTKYYSTWDDYKAVHPELYQGIDNIIAPKIKRYENTMYSFIINLCS